MEMTLKAARVNAGLTQNEAAKMVGTTKTTISNYERYLSKPSIERAQKLASAYGCTVNDLKFQPGA